MKTRSDIINTIIEKFKYNTYLEIGVKIGTNFKAINIKDKECVDPFPQYKQCNHVMTSDNFFENNTKKYDVIFVDGLHHAEQVERDIKNSLKFIHRDGCIIVHDCNPIDERHQVIPVGQCKTLTWNGDVWKAWVKAMSIYKFEKFTVDIDHGVGVINLNKDGKVIDINNELVYKSLEINRKQWLNLINIDEFIKWSKE